MAAGEKKPKLPAFFYRTAAGEEPVRAWLRELSDADRRVIGFDLHRVETGWPVGMPLCRPLGGGLWELRTKLPSERVARLLFFIQQDRIGVVHGFVKKTQKTPPQDLQMARRRMKEMQR
jgi:phage-related protein